MLIIFLSGLTGTHVIRLRVISRIVRHHVRPLRTFNYRNYNHVVKVELINLLLDHRTLRRLCALFALANVGINRFIRLLIRRTLRQNLRTKGVQVERTRRSINRKLNKLRLFNLLNLREQHNCLLSGLTRDDMFRVMLQPLKGAIRF